MPRPERVREFIDVVVGGEHVRAIADFYQPDASMQENLLAPRRGRDTLIAHESAVLGRVAAGPTHVPAGVVIDGDHVVIHWIFDFTDHKGVTRRLDELALQRWQGDRIIEERFVYDTATAWQVVERPGE